MHSEHWTFSVSVVHVRSYTEKWFVFRTVQLPVSSLVLVLELSASRFSWRCWVVDFWQISFLHLLSWFIRGRQALLTFALLLTLRHLLTLHLIIFSYRLSFLWACAHEVFYAALLSQVIKALIARQVQHDDGWRGVATVCKHPQRFFLYKQIKRYATHGAISTGGVQKKKMLQKCFFGHVLSTSLKRVESKMNHMARNY